MEKRKTELNIEIIIGRLSGKYGLPRLSSGYSKAPSRLMSFNEMKTADDEHAGIHFFIDDYQFERIWRSP